MRFNARTRRAFNFTPRSPRSSPRQRKTSDSAQSLQSVLLGRVTAPSCTGRGRSRDSKNINSLLPPMSSSSILLLPPALSSGSSSSLPCWLLLVLLLLWVLALAMLLPPIPFVEQRSSWCSSCCLKSWMATGGHFPVNAHLSVAGTCQPAYQRSSISPKSNTLYIEQARARETLRRGQEL